MQNNPSQNQQISYARLAGFLYVFLVILFAVGNVMIMQAQGAGDFTERAGKITASAGTYRLGLTLQLLASLGTVLLAFAQYVTLKPVNKNLAGMAMYWRLGEAFIGAVYVGFCYMNVGFIAHQPDIAAISAGQKETLEYLTLSSQGILLSVYQLFFSVGSGIFFYLFMKSKYIPPVLSGIGVIASVIAFVVCVASLMLPESAGKIQMGFAPVVLTEIVAGIWLMVRKISVGNDAENPAAAAY